MDCEKKKILQNVYEFLEKIQDQLPTKDLSLECSRMRVFMQSCGVGPKYLNVFEVETEVKCQLIPIQTPKNREVLHIVKKTSPFRSNSEKSTKSNEAITRVRGNSDGKKSNHSGSKLSPNLDQQYTHAAYNRNEQRSKLGSLESVHICKTPLPPTPKQFNRATQDSPKASPKEYEYTGDDIVLFLTPTPADTKFFSAKYNTEIPYENTNVYQVTEPPRLPQRKI